MTAAAPGPPERLWVFGVDHDAVQLTWRRMGPGEVRFRAGDASVAVVCDGGPGSVLLRPLAAATTHTVEVHGEAAGVPAGGLRRRVSTLPAPPGEPLFRFATISDVHIGEKTFGYFGTMREQPQPREHHPVRAMRAALRDINEWGAELLLVKGDCTNDGRINEWEQFGKLLAEAGLPWEGVPGNHDNRPVDRTRTPTQKLLWLVQGGAIRRLLNGPPDAKSPAVTPLEGFRSIGYEPPQPVHTIDVEGLRIVLADTSKTTFHVGGVKHAADDIHQAAADAARAGVPVFVAAHHYPMPMSIPHFWPPGVPAEEAEPFFTRLAAAATRPGAHLPSAFYTAGHTHRHRRYLRSGIVCTEVGSPKDYPGTWAAYTVYEGGITQVVWRVSAPDVLRWTDYSAGAAFGGWGLWSPGLRSHRCFHHAWPDESTATR